MVYLLGPDKRGYGATVILVLMSTSHWEGFKVRGIWGLMATHWWAELLESLGAELLGILLVHWWSGPGAYTFGFRIPKFVSAH